MADSARARRLAKRIVTIVATELQHQVKDPRLAMVTVTAATVTPDLREATVFYTVYGDEEEVASARPPALASATGVLRSAVGQQTGIKFTPTLASNWTPCRRTPTGSTNCSPRPGRRRRGRRTGRRRQLRR